eukprot:TRINITY_DN1615_c0_g1_i2.p2 TRINITY_DN1615_c0_g1~~TRINITY_DN1615_c0_g1_i2.p2  ORF type:complete len:183 (+),score=25.62 TRINITY_DN1615_c0_g1_i2:994-1542(+)
MFNSTVDIDGDLYLYGSESELSIKDTVLNIHGDLKMGENCRILFLSSVVKVYGCVQFGGNAIIPLDMVSDLSSNLTALTYKCHSNMFDTLSAGYKGVCEAVLLKSYYYDTNLTVTFNINHDQCSPPPSNIDLVGAAIGASVGVLFIICTIVALLKIEAIKDWLGRQSNTNYLIYSTSEYKQS